ncbi:Angiotensin-converting enzyme [Papilio xuthus]|uniref:Angiotensin-converting enzyme n=1 Tax=Papilio xuthus TaxID=66420 RepID=A0A194PVE2_PAPXU|nr:Angiotensin-converting enzyme [Papilio xuthus]
MRRVVVQEYLKFFLATVLEFQVFEQLCAAAGHAEHLHLCDLHRSREAGRLLGEVMQAGAAKPAGELLRALTRGRTDKISPEALVKSVLYTYAPATGPPDHHRLLDRYRGLISPYRSATCFSTNLIENLHTERCAHNHKYFRPLELWLRAQNRDAPLIGWKASRPDVALFTPRAAAAAAAPPLAPPAARPLHLLLPCLVLVLLPLLLIAH